MLGANSADDRGPKLQKKGKPSTFCLLREALGSFLVARGEEDCWRGAGAVGSLKLSRSLKISSSVRRSGAARGLCCAGTLLRVPEGQTQSEPRVMCPGALRASQQVE